MLLGSRCWRCPINIVPCDPFWVTGKRSHDMKLVGIFIFYSLLHELLKSQILNHEFSSGHMSRGFSDRHMPSACLSSCSTFPFFFP